MIIATLMAFTFWFWFGVGIAAAFDPIEQVEASIFGDSVVVSESYLSGGRVWFALLFGLCLTLVTWWVAKAIADGEA